MQLQTPPFLKKGDQIILLAPAGLITDEKPILLAEKIINNWGLKVVTGKHILEQDGSFAGTDQQRLEDLQKALDNPKIKAIWAVRGGYGTMRILSKLNFDKFIKNPKWLIGFSDITALHTAIQAKGFKSLHAIMPINLDKNEGKLEKALDSLYCALFGKDLEYIIPSSSFNKFGSAEGIVVGGNLSLIQSLIGSDTALKTKNKILFIEEVGEELYSIDRLLYSLKLAGMLKGLKALMVGSFTDIKPNKLWKDKTYQQIIHDVVKEYDYPVIFNVPAGHIDENRALIMGGLATINIGEFVCCVRFLQK